MNRSDTGSGFYVVGGTMQQDAASYVHRQADEDLYSGLREGQFCYVLTSSQVGKSSLMRRVSARLREEGASVAVVDLASLGENLTVEQWYLGLLDQIGQELDLGDKLEEFWQAHGEIGPLQRWVRALREVVLNECQGRVIIFIDEIGTTRKLKFGTDEFFSGIREFYNRRVKDHELNRLTFCLVGVATPTDLISNPSTTPFNIGRRIDLTDFTEQEAAILVRGLGRPEPLARKLLKRILYWTGGHPYLTQRLCQAVAREARATNAAGVDRVCAAEFLSAAAREREVNFSFVRNTILLRAADDVAALLLVYRRIRKRERVRDDAAQPLLNILRLSGIVRVREGFLRIRNRIYEAVFDRDWIERNLPLGEAERQRIAERQGRRKALKVAVPVALALLGLAVLTWRENQRAQASAAQAQKDERELKDKNAGLKDALRRDAQDLQEAKRQKDRADKSAQQAHHMYAQVKALLSRQLEDMTGLERAFENLPDKVKNQRAVERSISGAAASNLASAKLPGKGVGGAQAASSGQASFAKVTYPLRSLDESILKDLKAVSERYLKYDRRTALLGQLEAMIGYQDLHHDVGDTAALDRDCKGNESKAEQLGRSERYFERTLGAYLYAQIGQARMRRGESGQASRDAQRAAEVAATVWRTAKSQDSQNWRVLAAAYEAAATVQDRYNSAEPALQNYHLAVKSFEKDPHPSSRWGPTLFEDSQKAAQIQLRANRSTEALATYTEGINVAKVGLRRRPKDAGMVDAEVWLYILRGDVYRENLQQYSKTQADYSAAREAAQSMDVRTEDGQYDRAVCDERFGNLRRDEATKEKDPQARSKELQAALAFHHKSLAQFQQIETRNDTAPHATAVAMEEYNVGLDYLTLTRFDNARECYQARIKSLVHAAKLEPSNEATRRIANAYWDLSDVDDRINNHAAARDNLDREISVIKPLADKNSARDKRLAAIVFGGRSWEDRRLQDLQTAIKDAHTSLAYAEEAEKLNPGDVAILSHAVDAYVDLMNAQAQVSRKTGDRLAWYGKAIELANGWLQKHPKDATMLDRQFWFYIKRGDEYREDSQQYPEAEADYSSAQRTVANIDSRTEDGQYDRAICDERFGNLRRDQATKEKDAQVWRKELNAALEFHYRSLAKFQQIEKRNNTASHATAVAIEEYNVGLDYLTLRDFDNARKGYQARIEFLFHAAKLEPSDEATRRIANAYWDLIDVDDHINNHAAARDDLDREISVIKPLADRKNANAGDKRLAATAFAGRSWQDQKLRELKTAITDTQKRLTYEKEGAKLRPGDDATRYVASAYHDLSILENKAGNHLSARNHLEREIQLLEPLADRKGAAQEDKHRVAAAFGDCSWQDLLLGDFSHAVSDAQQGFSYDATQIWILTNKAHGYLFAGRFKQAKRIYLTYVNQLTYQDDPNSETFCRGVLNDFTNFEALRPPGMDLGKIGAVRDFLWQQPGCQRKPQGANVAQQQ